MFKKAVKSESKLRLAIAGPSGSGKTYTALAVATALADGRPVALVDTEHGSASKYADLFGFDVAEMHPPFHPDKFGQAIAEAANAGYAVIILDSLTHAWNGTGGMLDLVDEIAKRKGAGNTFAAWKDATPIQNRLIDAIIGAPIHVIVTMRSKQDYAQDKDEKGRTVIRKVGMAPQQRDGFEYEFDVFLDIDIDHNGIVSKTRCPALTDRVFAKPGKDIAGILAEWLKGEVPSTPQNGGTRPPAPPAPKPAASEQAERGESHDNPFTSDEAAELRKMHAIGTDLYGDGWNDKRHDLAKWASRGRTASSKQLTLAELRTLTAALAKRQAEREAAAIVDGIAEAPEMAH